MSNKDKLRQHFKQLRANLSPQEQEHAALNLKEQIKQNPLIQASKKIGIYLAHKNELNLTPSIKYLHQQNKPLFAPILHPHHQTFWFAPYQTNQALQKNKFGIQEPIYKLEDLLAPWELDLILIPALAIDKNHHRLGMGMGYYDRSLAFKKTNPLSKPVLIACIYNFQISNKDLPTNEFDILIDEIIST